MGGNSWNYWSNNCRSITIVKIKKISFEGLICIQNLAFISTLGEGNIIDVLLLVLQARPLIFRQYKSYDLLLLYFGLILWILFLD